MEGLLMDIEVARGTETGHLSLSGRDGYQDSDGKLCADKMI